MTILDKIIEHKKQEVERAKKLIDLEVLMDRQNYHRTTQSLKTKLKDTPGIIAEFKRQSPSKGVINNKVNPQDVIEAYEKYGASAVSILTDGQFFGGSHEDITNVRLNTTIPILRKDFMIDPYQFYEAKSMGADVVLLIAACITPSQVSDFTSLAHELGLEVLLEIHTESELGHYNSQIDFVGINNRNLKDFKVDLQHSVLLKNTLPTGVISVAESGIYSIEDYKFLKSKGFDGFLMGEYFMKNDDPAQAFASFIKEIESL